MVGTLKTCISFQVVTFTFFQDFGFLLVYVKAFEQCTEVNGKLESLITLTSLKLAIHGQLSLVQLDVTKKLHSCNIKDYNTMSKGSYISQRWTPISDIPSSVEVTGLDLLICLNSEGLKKMWPVLPIISKAKPQFISA